MNSTSHRRVRALATAVIGVLGIGLQVDTMASATPNTSTAAIAPGSVAAGSTAAYNFTITNTSGLTGNVLPLGSFRVTLPAGWGQPTFGTLPAGWTVASNSAGSWCLSDAAGLPSGTSATFPYTEAAPAVAGTGTFLTSAFVGQNCSLTLGTIPYDGSQPSVTVDNLAFTTAPSSGAVGQPLTYAVTAQTASGSTDADYAEPITLTSSGPISPATQTVTPTGGVASFAASYSSPGSFTATATSDGASVSSAAASIDQLVFIAHSTSGVVNKPITPGYTVQAQNASGAADTSFSQPITLSLGKNPTNISFTPITQTPSNGQTTFTPTLTAVGEGYTFLASSNGSTGVESQPVFVTPNATSVACQPNQTCDTGKVQGSTKTTEVDVKGASGSQYDVVSVAVGVSQVICAGATDAQGVFFGDFNRPMTVSLVYDKDKSGDALSEFTVKQAPTSKYYKPVCYQAASGPILKLPACSTNGNTAPCVTAEYTENNGDTSDIMAVINAPADPDPKITMP